MRFKLSIIRSMFWLCIFFGSISVTHWLSSSSQESRAFRYQRNYQSITEDDSNVKPKRKGLIIITYHRSGSSFLSQYFNQRNDTFFIYEPLLPYGLNCTNEPDERGKVEYLRSLLKCKMEDQRELSVKSDAVKDEKLMELLEQNCFPNNMCFRQNIRGMCTKEFCTIKHTPTCVLCEPVNTTLASMKCESAEIVVIKVIRMCNVKNLRPLIEDPSLDVKVLELIRDPRGVHASREKLKKQYLSQDVSSTCHKIVQNRIAVQNKKNDWIEQKYRLIRYEDVCQHPLKMGRQIYRFVGLSMIPEMEEWIKASTQGNLSHALDIRATMLVQEVTLERIAKAQLLKTVQTDSVRINPPTFREILNEHPMKETLLNDPYTTIRNSSVIWRKWTTELDFHSVVSVQKVCSIMMSIFHYLPIIDENQLMDPSTVVMQKFCPSIDLTLSKNHIC